ncbi:EamA family transporter RarD [Luteimonas sp. RD2P54]|uniref:EamA family transporter RarD n=1 Tax=Luteimonas endophytica TaxID=3042023 RepID=A0ABT6JD66_9GAMM|nr:EamA family transporter RarD [Luteimonas endophytica]MDH5824704.1 EamA family transporter RarD [Luteimonas endophytica]
MRDAAGETRAGLWTAAGAFVLWGLMPLYWHLLKAVPSLQIVAHRILWSTLLLVAWLAWKRGGGWLRATLAQPRLAWMLALSAMLIGCNWALYIWAVNAGHVIETSLGYFINPLLNVVIGVLFLRERLSAPQWVSVAMAAAGVLWLTFNYGNFPWIALGLALSFAMYGLVRKLAAVESIPGLGVESLYLLLPGLALLLWGETHGQGGFLDGWGAVLVALLVFGGALTALPLIGFAYAVRRVPLSVVGVMQYIAPTLQFLLGVFFFLETFDRERAIGFAFIWAALAVFAFDGWRRSRRRALAPVA